MAIKTVTGPLAFPTTGVSWLQTLTGSVYGADGDIVRIPYISGMYLSIWNVPLSAVSATLTFSKDEGADHEPYTMTIAAAGDARYICEIERHHTVEINGTRYVEIAVALQVVDPSYEILFMLIPPSPEVA